MKRPESCGLCMANSYGCHKGETFAGCDERLRKEINRLRRLLALVRSCRRARERTGR